MTMTFSLHENPEFGWLEPSAECVSSITSRRQSDELHLLAEKLEIPKAEQYLARPRLSEALTKSLDKFGTTLITGRAGTGKTALAVDFAALYKRTAWLRIDSADADWKIFARYFSACLDRLAARKKSAASAFERKNVSQFTENKLGRLRLSNQKNAPPTLIVVDNLHHIFDAVWFEDFFPTLLYSLPPKTHLLLLARGTPALPLWRLRSKQILGVVDEKLLAFNIAETNRLFEEFAPSAKTKPAQAFADSFGRISRLRRFLEA